MKVSTFDPQIKVTLYKTVIRKGLTNKSSASDRYHIPFFDLTQYLGDGGGVRVSKGVHGPAGGFTLTFPDSPVRKSGEIDVMESIYGLVEPMDLVEIRFARNVMNYRKEDESFRLPIIMRGWVTDVRRNESIGQDGKPNRSVVVSGQDYGKILQILRIYYINNAASGDNIMHGFAALQKYGLESDKNLPIDEFLSLVGEKIVNPWIADLIACKARFSEEWLSVKLDSSAIGMVNYQYINNFAGGTVYELMASVCDVNAGFKELFVEDREDGVYLVCRMTPWYDADGMPIQKTTPKEILAIDVLDTDIVSLSCSRSDAGVANAFWIRCPAWNLLTDDLMRLQADYGLPEYGINNNVAQYGYRILEEEIHCGSPDGYLTNRLPEAQQKDASTVEALWIHDHKQILRTMKSDEVVFESGQMRLRGNEKIRAGQFIGVRRGRSGNAADPGWIGYVTQVDHEFMPYQGFFTTVKFERGTGFVERAKRATSPYLSEITPDGLV